MKKILFSSLLLLVVTLFTQCNPTSEVVVQPKGKYSDGVVILNEGNFNQANGNITFMKYDTQEFFSDIIKAENNNVGINATVQNALDYIGKTYVVTNAPDQLLVFNSSTFKNEAVISTGFNNPFGVTIANNKAYITEWGNDYFNNAYANAKINVVNLSTKQIVNSFVVGKEVNNIIALNNKLYVAVTGEDKVWVINPDTDLVETKISVAGKPSSFVVDASGQIWVLCSSKNLVRINPSNNTVLTTISGVSVGGYNEKIVTDATRTNLYWIGMSSAGFTGVGIFKMSITATTAPTSPLIVGEKFYGLGFIGASNQIVAGVTDYSTLNEVRFYTPTGGQVRSISSGGFLPNGFLYR